MFKKEERKNFKIPRLCLS